MKCASAGSTTRQATLCVVNVSLNYSHDAMETILQNMPRMHSEQQRHAMDSIKGDGEHNEISFLSFRATRPRHLAARSSHVLEQLLVRLDHTRE